MDTDNTTSASTSRLPSIFDPVTCRQKGLCQVAQGRASSPHNLYYEIHGQDIPHETAHLVVFIMGLNNSCFGWHNQIQYFSKQPGYLSLVMDNRGVGNSDTPWGLYKTSEMAYDLVELLDFVQWTREKSLHIVGVSMGGMIAQELATLIPSRVRSLVLTSTTAGNTNEVAPASALKMFAKLFFVKDAKRMVELVIANLYPEEYLDNADEKGDSGSNRERIEKEFLTRYNITRRQTIMGRILQSGAAMGHKVTSDRLAGIAKQISPILIITGDCDTIVNPERSKDLHEMMPGSEYIVVPGGGHALPSQCTTYYNELLQKCFERP